MAAGGTEKRKTSVMLKQLFGSPFGKVLLFVVFAVQLIACGGGNSNSDTDSASSDVNDIVLAGSVGDGPVTGATVEVWSSNGRLIKTVQSDNTASFSSRIRVWSSSYPLLLKVQGGVDLVTGNAPDFEMASVKLDRYTGAVNINPFSTLIVKIAQSLPGGVNEDNVQAAKGIVTGQLGFGLDPDMLADPISTPVTDANIANLVKSSEAMGEMIRRTRDLISATGVSTSGDAVLAAIAADLQDGSLDGKGAAGTDPRITAVVQVVSGQVLVEALANTLKVDGIVATAVIDQAIKTTRSESSGVALTESVRVTDGMLQQTQTALAAARVLDASSEVLGLYTIVSGIAAGALPADVANILPADSSRSLDNAVLLASTADVTLVAAVNVAGQSDGQDQAAVEPGTTQPDTTEPGMAATDTTPPTVPQNLNASAVSDAATNLSWSASTDAASGVAGYHIYRDGDLATPIGTTTATNYTDTGADLPDGRLAANTTYSYQVSAYDSATSRNESALSASASVTTLVSNLWTSSDIGKVATAGSFYQSGSSFVVKASGADIWGSSDEFHFAYQTLSGDGEIIARVTDLTNTAPWAKAGVMIRESLSASAAHAMMAVTPGNGTAFQRRPVTGGSSLHQAGPAAAAPYWVRLVRQGNLFSAYASSDGSNWTLVGTETIAMASDVYIGLAATSHNDGAVATAIFRGVSVTGAGITDPGTIDLGITDPGATDPGTIDPSITDPGTTDPGTTDPGTIDPGITDPGTTDPGTTDPGTTDPGTTDPGAIDPGITDPGITDPGTDTLGSFSLTWTAPVTRTDGAPLSLADIDGYRIHYGTSAGKYPATVDIKDGSAQSTTVNDIPTGTYYLVMTTYDTSGSESDYSAEVVKVAQ